MAMPAAVFQPGPLTVDVRHVAPRVTKPAMVVTPTDAGTYPVAVFLHGFNKHNRDYEQLLRHVASHGFILIAPQLYGFTFTLNDEKDIEATKLVTNWLADQQEGLLHVLKDIFKLDDVKPDLERLALAGHSRGGDTAFAVALGLGDAKPKTELALQFSALIGVDPVAGVDKGIHIEPKVLTYKPRSLDVGMPVLVIGTGKGPDRVGGIPCAPAGVNHAEFYEECCPPRYHFVVTDYGHMDMVDDGVNHMTCVSGDWKTQHLARKSIGGVMVAFLRATLQHKDGDLQAVLDHPGLAPVKLHPVEHELA